MKLTYFGTAAAEGVPALFCGCETCKIAQREKGKNIRTRSQALVNDDLLIDFPPDTYLHVLNYGLDLDTVKNILITHSHCDHIHPSDISFRMRGYCAQRPSFMLQVYGNEAVQKLIEDYIVSDDCKEAFEEVVAQHTIAPFIEYKIGAYCVYPLCAAHAPNEQALMYIVVDKEGKTLLYAHDTGWFPDDTWEFLKNFTFDAVSLDCTCAFLDVETGHMGLNCCKKIKDRLIEFSCADEKTKFVLNHFSHNGKLLSHENLCKEGAKLGFEISFDGMVLEF